MYYRVHSVHTPTLSSPYPAEAVTEVCAIVLQTRLLFKTPGVGGGGPGVSKKNRGQKNPLTIGFTIIITRPSTGSKRPPPQTGPGGTPPPQGEMGGGSVGIHPLTPPGGGGVANLKKKPGRD